MTVDNKNLLDVLLVGSNIAFSIAAFGMTLWINSKNNRIERQLKSMSTFIDKENELRVEAKRMARDKTLALLGSMDNLFEKLKLNDQSAFKEIDYQLKITLRKEYFAAQIYLPNAISDAIYEFLAACIRAVGHFSLQDKYWGMMEDVAKMYTKLVITIRRTFYFESADLAPMVETEIAKLQTGRQKSAL
jgi:hypothetical protein